MQRTSDSAAVALRRMRGIDFIHAGDLAGEEALYSMRAAAARRREGPQKVSVIFVTPLNSLNSLVHCRAIESAARGDASAYGEAEF